MRFGTLFLYSLLVDKNVIMNTKKIASLLRRDAISAEHAGYDERFCLEGNTNATELYNIKKNMHHLLLLNHLQNNKVSLYDKKAFIDKHDILTNGRICSANLQAAGLWNDYFFEII